MMRNEAGKRTDFRKHANFVDLLDHRIQHFALKGPEDDGFVLHGINHESLARLDDSGSDLVYCRDRYHESILSRAGALHLGVELLLHGLQQLRAKVAWMQQDLVLQRYLRWRRVIELYVDSKIDVLTW